ncbi:MAG: hypothetical protein [Caudoviricetes sp.]|nr:MAG: hypothetical protein [Caudoviricetes sp.]
MDNAEVSSVVESNKNVESSNADVGEYFPKTQAELDELMGREKFRAAEKAAEKVKRDLEAKYQAEIEKLKADRSGASVVSSEIDTNAISEQVIARLQQDMLARQAETEKAAYEAEMNRVSENYFSKLKAGGEKISDFDEVMADFDHTQFPQLVWAASGLDNTDEIMYHLANNPQKLEKINGWLKSMPNRGLKELKNLSDSIRETNAAVDDYQPTNAPLSQIKSSNVSAGSGLSELERLKQDRKYMF